MKGHVVDNDQSSGVRFSDVPDPSPAPNEAVIEVEAFSLSSGELPGRAFSQNGTVPRWDTAGRVVTAAADGSGPSVGTRVDAWDRLTEGGILVSVGSVTGSPATFPPYGTVLPHNKSLVAMGSGWTPLLPGETIKADLAYLARLVATRTLGPHITWRGSWKQLPDAIALLQHRKISGKAVLRVD